MSHINGKNGHSNGHMNGHTKACVNRLKQRRVPYDIYPVQEFDIDLLVAANYNPEDRMDPKSNQQIRNLAAGIEATRTCADIWVTPRLTIIEGHRTCAALKIWGATHAPCKVYDGDPAHLYMVININQKPLSARHKLFIYTVNPSAVSPYMRNAFARMERTVGMEMMKETFRLGGCLATFTQARTVAKKVGREEEAKYITKVLKWLLRHHMTCAVRQFLDLHGPVIELANAIRRNVPLCTC